MPKPSLFLAAFAYIGAANGFSLPTAKTAQKSLRMSFCGNRRSRVPLMANQEDIASTEEMEALDSSTDGITNSMYTSKIAKAMGSDTITPDAAAGTLVLDDCIISSEGIIPPELLTKDVTSSMESVEIILAVAQQATAAAEASLPEQVSGSIPLLPTHEFNDTMTVPEGRPSSHEVEKFTVYETFDYPSVKRIITFAASATGVYLCSPLLSLIDTSAVGLLSGTAQQAALNPAVAVTDYAALLIVS